MAARSKRDEERRYTYADYCTWPEDQRCELIDGKVYAMNTPLRIHQKVSGELFFQFFSYLKGKKCEVYAAPFDIRLPHASKNDSEIFTVVQPDLSIICDPDKLDDKGCVGAPDLAIEILSPSSSSYDNIKKRALYERVGVKEFWLVHPSDMLVTVYKLVGGAYGKPEIYDQTAKVRPGLFSELTIDLAAVFGVEESPAEVKEDKASYLAAKPVKQAKRRSSSK